MSARTPADNLCVNPKKILQRSLMMLLFGAMSLRALIPAGYMPAAGNDGALFELCHDAVPMEVLAWLSAGHAGQQGGAHAHHGAGHADSAGSEHEPCAVGHMLSMVYVDDAAIPMHMVRQPPAATIPAAIVEWDAVPHYHPETRAPPRRLYFS